MGYDPEYQRQYYLANREKRIAQARQNQAANREHRREYNREWNERNRERVREYRRATADQRNARRRERYATDPAYREQSREQAKTWRTPEARRDARLRKQFGISAEQYDYILANQDGCCAICRATIGDGAGRRLHVDHCHDTGRVRGILCSECNLGLGKFRDDAFLLGRAVEYLTQA